MIDDVSLDGVVVSGHLCFFRSEISMTGFSANGSPSSLEFWCRNLPDYLLNPSWGLLFCRRKTWQQRVNRWRKLLATMMLCRAWHLNVDMWNTFFRSRPYKTPWICLKLCFIRAEGNGLLWFHFQSFIIHDMTCQGWRKISPFQQLRICSIAWPLLISLDSLKDFIFQNPKKQLCAL